MSTKPGAGRKALRPMALGLVLPFIGMAPALAADPVTYLLLPDSVLVDDCLLCGRPAVESPLAGSFQLRDLGGNGLYENYAVENLALAAGRDGAVAYAGSGAGTYRQGGEVALRQDAFLDLSLTNGAVVTHAYFTNATPSVTVSLPDLRLQLAQTNGTFIHLFSLDLHAEPAGNFSWRVVAADPAKVTLAWPAKFGVATAFRATQLGPLPDWQEVPLKASPVGAEYRATLAVTNTAGYFRLHVP